MTPSEECDVVFYNNLYEIEKNLHFLVHKVEKIRVEQWIRKLLEPCSILTWKKNRNRYSELLLYMVRNKSFKYPFETRPPQGELATLPSYMLKYIADYTSEPKRIKSPDGKKETTLKRFIRATQMTEMGTEITTTRLSTNSTFNSSRDFYSSNFSDSFLNRSITGIDNRNGNGSRNDNRHENGSANENKYGNDEDNHLLYLGEIKSDSGNGSRNGSRDGNPLLLSTLNKSPEKSHIDEYHEVLDHLEQKYIASLESLNTMTDKGEAIQDSLYDATTRISKLESQLDGALTQLDEAKKKNTQIVKSHADQILKMSFAHQREMNKIKEHYHQEIAGMLPRSIHQNLERTIVEQKKRTELIEKQMKEREEEYLTNIAVASPSKISHEQEEGLVKMLKSQLKEAKDQIQQLNVQIHDSHLQYFTLNQQCQQLRDEADSGHTILEAKQNLEKEVQKLIERMREKDTEIAQMTRDHRVELEELQMSYDSKLESMRTEYLTREETLSLTEQRMVKVGEDNRKLLEVVRKQEKLIEELNEAAEQSNTQKLNNFQQSQALHKSNKMQIAKLQEELQRLVDDNDALHKVMAEEQERFSKELSKMKEENEKQMVVSVTKAIQEREETIKGLEQRLHLLEAHFEDRNKMHQQELAHTKQLHKLQVENSLEKLKKDMCKHYEEQARRSHAESSHVLQNASHLARVSEEQRTRIAALEQTIADIQGINRLRSSQKLK